MTTKYFPGPAAVFPSISRPSKKKRAAELRPSKSEGDINSRLESMVVATHANLVRLPRFENENVPLPNAFFERHHHGASVVIGRAPERPLEQTFDAKFVVMLRNFFIEIAADGSAMAQRRAFNDAIGRPEYRTMGELVFEELLGPTGQPAFSALLRRYYPSATKAELSDMIRVAFPRPRRVHTKSVGIDERRELTHLFNMFDTDRSSSLSLLEFLTATKSMNTVKADQVFWMYAADANGDGELSLEEWIHGMHNCYF
eukprot:TRINITY_DN26650_c0_g1_i1.p2 TRINITY_DN26650_c0_g1~~TRINITY_DN26650_c0_g1_i1.p2  ORF type:complete len:257 (+),score=63.68 TRINITY_DN26650_c0_g1_i1:1506-2276(+)